MPQVGVSIITRRLYIATRAMIYKPTPEHPNTSG